MRLRGSVDVRLSLDATDLDGEAVHEDLPPRPVELYGPGDVVGVDSRAIIRNEPRDWITNFETNYIPFVEFYDEDFPWRYTPAAPSADRRRLRPWLALVVLEEGEIASEGAAGLGRPLSFVEVVDAATKFPPAADLWAWAHVHVNGGLGVDPTDTDGLAAALDATVRADRDQAYSRLLCPRILKPNTGYHAFVLPTFESGRLAGLGKDPAGAPFATESAWSEYAGREDANLYPYYHRWYFRTASVGDFEYLVRLLQPRTVKPEVGRRDIDVQAPGATLPGIPELGGILRLGGALRAPLATLSLRRSRRPHALRGMGQAVPARVPDRTRLVRQPRRRLPHAGGAGRERRERSRRRRGRRGPADRRCRCTAAGTRRCNASSRRTRIRRRGTGSRSSTSIHAIASPPASARTSCSRTRRATWRPPGSRSARCWRRTRRSASDSWRHSSRPCGTRARSSRCSRAHPSRC